MPPFFLPDPFGFAFSAIGHRASAQARKASIARGVDERERVELNRVERLFSPLVVSARGVFSEPDKLLPASQEFELAA